MSGEIVFYTKLQCPLCDEGILEVMKVAERYGIGVKKMNIQDDAALYSRHRFRIPVVEYAGVEIGWGRLEAKELEKNMAPLTKRKT